MRSYIQEHPWHINICINQFWSIFDGFWYVRSNEQWLVLTKWRKIKTSWLQWSFGFKLSPWVSERASERVSGWREHSFNICVFNANHLTWTCSYMNIWRYKAARYFLLCMYCGVSWFIESTTTQIDTQYKTDIHIAFVNMRVFCIK